MNLLLEDNKPIGGKWSFDEDNRKKLPLDMKYQSFQLLNPIKNLVK